jgi:hypothetical protein
MPTRRRERNQQLFRAVNQRISEIGDSLLLEFICECANTGCVELLLLSRDEYEHILRGSSYFVVKPGHEGRAQPIVLRTRNYIVVEGAVDAGSVSATRSAESAEVAKVDAGRPRMTCGLPVARDAAADWTAASVELAQGNPGSSVSEDRDREVRKLRNVDAYGRVDSRRRVRPARIDLPPR